jgi:hypothetical protein
MSYMADTDHIAITSRDTSTTSCKFLYRDAPVVPSGVVTRSKGSTTYRPMMAVSEILPGYAPGSVPEPRFAIPPCRCGDTRRRSSQSYGDIPGHAKLAITITRSSLL